MRYIISDPIDAGKSSTLINLVKFLHKRNILVSGWISPGYIRNKIKIGYDLCFVCEKQITKPIKFIRPHNFTNSVEYFNRHFNAEVFKISSILNSKPYSIFIMDEIGPVELMLNSGFIDIVTKVHSKNNISISVVRDNLLEKYLSMFSVKEYKIITVNELNNFEETLNLIKTNQ